ncbi:hypothetical protein A9Q81_22125, partial [Gammaproteobacteria bacterium 42_54_T18]
MKTQHTLQQHVIFGAGLIGGFLYGVLASQGVSAAMVARSSVRKKLQGGLHLSDYNDNRAEIDSPHFVAAGELVTDFLWLTVKCTAIASVITELASFVNQKTVIFCCQNGLGSDELIKQAFPNNRILKVTAVPQFHNIDNCLFLSGSSSIGGENKSYKFLRSKRFS